MLTPHLPVYKLFPSLLKSYNVDSLCGIEAPPFRVSLGKPKGLRRATSKGFIGNYPKDILIDFFEFPKVCF